MGRRTKLLGTLLEDESFRKSARAGRELFPDLEVWQQAFLSCLGESNDRVESAQKVGKRWSDVEQSLQMDQAFLDAFEEVNREAIVRLEDRNFKAALEGKNASQAKMVLEARSGVYRKGKGAKGNGPGRSVAVKSTFDAASEWSRIFGLKDIQGKESDGSRATADSGVSVRDSVEIAGVAAAGLS